MHFCNRQNISNETSWPYLVYKWVWSRRQIHIKICFRLTRRHGGGVHLQTYKLLTEPQNWINFNPGVVLCGGGVVVVVGCNTMAEMMQFIDVVGALLHRETFYFWCYLFGDDEIVCFYLSILYIRMREIIRAIPTYKIMVWKLQDAEQISPHTNLWLILLEYKFTIVIARKNKL